MADTVFATYDDYAKRYGASNDKTKVETLLADASTAIQNAYETFWGSIYEKGDHPAFDRAVTAVCCAVANRSLSVPAGFEGASQYSQTAGSYNASITFSNPTGDLYLSKSDLKKLGLIGQRIRTIAPVIDKDAT